MRKRSWIRRDISFYFALHKKQQREGGKHAHRNTQSPDLSINKSQKTRQNPLAISQRL